MCQNARLLFLFTKPRQRVTPSLETFVASTPKNPEQEATLSLPSD